MARIQASRKLQVTVAGRWFILLTIALGVAALESGNNIIYLIESLLLSGMILSGVLSESAVSGVSVDIRRHPLSAKGKCRDEIRVTNRRRSALHCLEIGEWRAGKFVLIAYLPSIGPRATVTLRSGLRVESRGLHEWEGTAIATSYPFGFARKINVLWSEGRRVVWPEPLPSGEAARAADGRRARAAMSAVISEGEVRLMNYDDDHRWIVWPLSMRGQEPVVRVRSGEASAPDAALNLRVPGGEPFERKVRELASLFAGSEVGGSLTLIDQKGRRYFAGRVNALNQLALAKAAGAARSERGSG